MIQQGRFSEAKKRILWGGGGRDGGAKKKKKDYLTNSSGGLLLVYRFSVRSFVRLVRLCSSMLRDREMSLMLRQKERRKKSVGQPGTD